MYNFDESNVFEWSRRCAIKVMLRRTITLLLIIAPLALAQAPPVPQDAPPPGAPAGQGPPPGNFQGPPPWAIPQYRLLHADEDFSYLANPLMRGHDWLDPLKYIPLGHGENWYLTIGGEMRQWFEDYRNENWGAAPNPPDHPVENNAYLKQRYMLSGDFHLGNRFRVFGELQSGFVNFRSGGPRPIVDKDNLDVNQAFVDVNLGLDDQEKPTVTLRAGRQELHYGSGRLVSIREVPNVRASFDGLRLIVNTRKWRIDTFAVKPVFTQPGFFDDKTDHTQTFWGVYATGPVRSLPFTLDVYYLGLMRKLGVFNQGAGPETRQTLGARIWKGGIPFMVGRGWDYDVEYAGQFGTIGPSFTFQGGVLPKGNIRAWTVSTQTGYTFNEVKMQPRIAINTGITSGDKDPRNPDLQTFFTPYPNGRFFGVIQENGPLNIAGFRPSVTIQLPHRMAFTADSYFFWRESTNDAFYNVPGFPLRPGNFSNARYVGTQPGMELYIPVTKHVTADLNYAYFATGQFLHETPPDKNLTYVGLIFIYRF